MPRRPLRIARPETAETDVNGPFQRPMGAPLLRNPSTVAWEVLQAVMSRIVHYIKLPTDGEDNAVGYGSTLSLWVMLTYCYPVFAAVTDTDGKRQTLRLGKVTKKNAEEVSRRVEYLLAAKISGDSIDASTSAWIRGLEGNIRDRLAKLGLADPRAKRMQLGEFLDKYIADRGDVKASTITTYEKAKKNLIDYFKADRRLETITKVEVANLVGNEKQQPRPEPQVDR